MTWIIGIIELKLVVITHYGDAIAARGYTHGRYSIARIFFSNIFHMLIVNIPDTSDAFR